MYGPRNEIRHDGGKYLARREESSLVRVSLFLSTCARRYFAWDVKVKYSEGVTIDFSRERRKNRFARLRICLRWKILNKKVNINKIKKLIKYWNKKVFLFVSWESWSTIPSKTIVKVEFHSEQKRKWNGIVWKFSIEKKEERRELFVGFEKLSPIDAKW